MTKSVYEQIKKQNGEAFARTIRDFDAGIFELPNIVKRLKYAGRDAEPIKELLSSFRRGYVAMDTVSKTPFELLKQAGYRAFYADNLKKQRSIAYLFAPGEGLCTFRDEDRFKLYHIIHCVKEGAENLKRSNFKDPKREDEYGRSVISIQISKEGGFIKITNRYNHTVENPDNTFNSNPDNIINGLTLSLKKYFNVEFASHQKIPENFIMMNNSLVRYNFEKNNKYFGDGFYVKDGFIHEIDKDKELLIDCFVLNLKKKEVRPLVDFDVDSFLFGLDESSYLKRENPFVTVLEKELEGKKLQVKTLKKGTKALYANNIKILETKDSALTYLHLRATQYLPADFLSYNTTLCTFFAPMVKEIGPRALNNNRYLKSLYLPRVQKIGSCFLEYNYNLTYLNAPLVEEIDNRVMREVKLKHLIAPCLKSIGTDSFIRDRDLELFSAPWLQRASGGVLACNKRLTRLYAPNLLTENPFSCLIYISNYQDLDDCFLSLHPERKKLMKHKSNLKRMLKKERIWERFLLWVKE